MHFALQFLKITFIVLGLLYAGVCVLLYFNQESLLFFPQPRSLKQTMAGLDEHPDFDSLGLIMNDGNKVYGYISKDTASGKLPLVIYFGGNAEEVGFLMAKKHYLGQARFVLFNYRGYGMSRGSVSQDNMFSDALQLYDRLTQDTGIDKSRVFVLGRSIGTGVAVYVSAQRPVCGTVLFTPYESMTSVAREKFPFLPMRLLIKHPFPSETYAPTIHTPVLALIATRDRVIPPVHAQRLLSVWKGKTEFLEVDEDHGSIIDNDSCWKRVEAFITEKR